MGHGLITNALLGASPLCARERLPPQVIAPARLYIFDNINLRGSSARAILASIQIPQPLFCVSQMTGIACLKNTNRLTMERSKPRRR